MTEFTLYGTTPSKKNQRIPGRKGGNFPPKAYTEWLPGAELIAKAAHRGEPYKGWVAVTINAYGLGNDSDNLESSLFDMMQGPKVEDPVTGKKVHIGLVYYNDHQVDICLTNMHRREKVKREDRRCVVRVEELPEHD